MRLLICCGPTSVPAGVAPYDVASALWSCGPIEKVGLSFASTVSMLPLARGTATIPLAALAIHFGAPCLPLPVQIIYPSLSDKLFVVFAAPRLSRPPPLPDSAPGFPAVMLNPALRMAVRLHSVESTSRSRAACPLRPSRCPRPPRDVLSPAAAYEAATPPARTPSRDGGRGDRADTWRPRDRFGGANERARIEAWGDSPYASPTSSGRQAHGGERGSWHAADNRREDWRRRADERESCPRGVVALSTLGPQTPFALDFRLGLTSSRLLSYFVGIAHAFAAKLTASSCLADVTAGSRGQTRACSVLARECVRLCPRPGIRLLRGQQPLRCGYRRRPLDARRRRRRRGPGW